MNALKRMLSIPEFVEQHGVSRSTVYREIKANRLRVVRVGRRTLVARADADAWMKALRSASLQNP